MATDVSIRFPNPTLASWADHRPGTGRMGRSEPLSLPRCTLSIVVPVYNGSATVGSVVEEMLKVLADDGPLEGILVDDGSRDQSPAVCAALAEKHAGEVVYIQLSRNFGEHNAVMAGLRAARGEYVAIVDDDGQHPAEDVGRMLEHARRHDLDVVYGRFRRRCHPWLRVLGSWCVNRMAEYLLRKPRGLYLSSFKVISRFAIDELCRYQGPTPYVDGLLLRVTDRIAQIEVEHRPRAAGRSGYSISKLLALWWVIAVEYSPAPFRAALTGGLILALLGAVALVVLGVVGLFVDTTVHGWWWVVAATALVGGLLCSAAGLIGEYLSRIMQHLSGMPQQVTRSITHGRSLPECPAGSPEFAHRVARRTGEA
jgi:hypothetical protein